MLYYGSKLSDNMTRLNDGCLLCLNVPIARTGTYEYLREEVGLDGSGTVTVYRTPEEVFSTKTIASFNGKAFCDTHPSVDVTSDNWSIYSKGEVTNVKRGADDESDYLLADIIVRDPIVINEIYSGAKREISAGYDCEFVERDGKLYQCDIIGNHVALVQCGRAGPNVRIKDSKNNSYYRYVKKMFKAIDKINI